MTTLLCIVNIAKLILIIGRSPTGRSVTAQQKLETDFDKRVYVLMGPVDLRKTQK